MTNLLAYYPDDWVIVTAGPRCAKVAGSFRFTYGACLCPRSIWEDPVSRKEWLRTGVVPDGTPELKRIASVRNLQ